MFLANTITLVLAVFFAALCVQAQPAMSRSEQLLQIGEEECVLMARATFTEEGWRVVGSGSGFVYGSKGTQSSYILCTSVANDRVSVNIIVAGPSEDTNGVNSERGRLQGRMGRAPISTVTSEVVKAFWGTNAVRFRGQSVRVTYECPADGGPVTVWGTDTYTDDSAVCVAAVHAGIISFANGGRVTIETRGGLQSYQGTTRNGVTTVEYGRWDGSFVFVR